LPSYSVARLAESDLRSILLYTLRTWGSTQAKRYSLGLRNCFQLLADSPSIGRGCDAIHAGLRRFEQGKHVVFYLNQPDGILIVRVLHQQMLPNRAYFEQ
jgi:toxin ParE1/3/4